MCFNWYIYNKIKLNEVELYTGFEGVQNDTLQLELRLLIPALISNIYNQLNIGCYFNIFRTTYLELSL